MKLAARLLMFLALWMAGGLIVPSPLLATPAAAPVSTYEVHGVLKHLDLTTRQLTISHDAIPGYMPAMTMTFDVRDAAPLPDLEPGDKLAFHLCVTAEQSWIEQVRKTGAEATPPFEPRPPDASSRELSVGDLLPNVTLVSQAGANIRLTDFRGQTLAITFIYARCPLPNFCPLMNRNFQVAQSLLTRLGGGDRWHLLSVSMDPLNDTPGVLNTIAVNYQAEAAHWTFATADEQAVRQFGNAVGLEFTNTGGVISHNLRTVVVDGAGRIRRIFQGNAWTPQELAAEMRSAMDAPR